MGKELIKVITGQRRVGKSIILKQLADKYKKTWPDHGLVFIDLELPEYFTLRSVEAFIDYVHEKSSDKEKTAVFIDEVQEIEHFEIALRGLNAEKKYDVYCTGSNADILSGDLSTHLSERYVAQTVHSLSYIEFLEFHHLEDSNASFLRYIRQGGLPYLINLPADDDIVAEYLKSITETVLYRDTVLRLIQETFEENTRQCPYRECKFILTGSSARKLKRAGVDLLAERALVKTMHPFILSELEDLYTLDAALEQEMVPLVAAADDPCEKLKSYIAIYIQEEVKQEGLVRNVGNFSRFLEIVSFSHGAEINASNIARE